MGIEACVYGERCIPSNFPMMVTQSDRQVLVWGNGAEWAKYVSGPKHPIFFLENIPPLCSLDHHEHTHSCYFCSGLQKHKAQWWWFSIWDGNFFSNKLIWEQSNVGHTLLEYGLYHKWPRSCVRSPHWILSPILQGVGGLFSPFCRCRKVSHRQTRWLVSRFKALLPSPAWLSWVYLDKDTNFHEGSWGWGQPRHQEKGAKE